MQRPGIQEHISIVRNGDPLPVNLLVSPLVQEGRLLGAVILFQDISEERRIDDMKSEFISLASHQLRTPISILNWYMELLGGDPKALNPEQAEYVREMRVAASRMSGLLNALLQVARLEGGIVEVNAHAVHVQAMMKEVLEDAAGMAKPKGITCTIDLPKASLELHTDGALLKVVLQNLATNAVKYGKKGGMLRITAADTPTAVRFTVADDGAGIPRSEQQKIFQKFFRARNVRQFDTDGNGLGLYMSKMIVDGLKGSLEKS
jgi:two-component system sensor histidine kinase ResE